MFTFRKCLHFCVNIIKLIMIKTQVLKRRSHSKYKYSYKHSYKYPIQYTFNYIHLQHIEVNEIYIYDKETIYNNKTINSVLGH